jgi:nicotinate-nucleotide adenylyltransferase
LTGPTGVFGGTFDPIHYGHLRTAFEMLQALAFSEVRFMPCGDPPHRGITFADSELRLRMVCAATAYSIDTLASLREEFPGRSLGLIVGMDAFLGLTEWHRWDEILDYAHIVVAHRPGWKAPDYGALGRLLDERGTHRVQDLHENTSGQIHVHAVTQLEIASTEIRELIAAGRDPRFLMPDAVRDVIIESACYANETS